MCERRLTMGEKRFEKCYNLKLDWSVFSTAYCVSVGWLRYYLLLTAIHRLLASAIHDYLHSFTTSNYLHCHDSIRPGVAPVSLRKPRKSAEHRPHGIAKKKDAGLYFERVFSD